MKKFCFLLLLCSVTLYAQSGGRLIPSPLRKIPKWVRDEFFNKNFDRDYTIIYTLYPVHLRGDFNGDDRRDVAIQIRENKSGKDGIMIFHSKRPEVLVRQISILGAGNPLGKAGNDFQWVDIWSLYPKKNAAKEMKGGALESLNGDVLKIEKRDSTSGFIYWNGYKYDWYKLKK